MIKILSVMLLTLLCQVGFTQTETSDSSGVEDIEEAPIEAREEVGEAEDAVEAVDSAADAATEAIEAVEEAAAAVEAATLATSAVKRNIYEDTDYAKTYFEDDDTISLYTEDDAGLRILDSVVGNYEIFISGENHTYTESNARIWLKMIKYLHKHAGVRNIMFEYGYSYGFLVNEYLRTGDTTLFSSIDQFAYIEYSNALEDLKKFNDSLPEGDKLYFSAIDIERGIYPIAKVLDRLMPEHNDAHDSISLHIQSVKSLAAYNDYKLDEEDNEDTKFGYNRGFTFKSTATLDLVHTNFKKFEMEYEAYLGDNFAEFKKVIIDNYSARNTWLGYENTSAIQEYIYRENYMHKRFLEEQKNHPGNWFGQFGRCHTTQSKQNSNSCDWFKFNSLADRIKNTKGDAFKDKVMTIAIIYEEDRNMGHEKDTLERYFDKYFEDVPQNSMVLLDISKDSVLQKGYGSDFNYVFLNTYTDRGEVYDYLDYLAYEEPTDNFKATIGAVMQNFSFGKLNQVFQDAGTSESFEESQVGLEFMFIGGADGFYSGLSGGWYKTQEVNLNNNYVYTLDNFYIKDLFYFNITKNTKWIDLMPGFGFGYGQLKLRTQEKSNGGVNQGFLGELRNTVYINPAFIIDISGIIDINIGPFTLGYGGGYNIDASNKYWRTDGEIMDDTPKTSLGGLFQSGRVGFTF